MATNIEFYFDFGSPTAYLAFYRLRELAGQYNANIEYKPVLLGGLFKATGNSSPVAVIAKGNYMLSQDLPRFSQRYRVPLRHNPFFPINTLALMRGAIAAQRLSCFDDYAVAVFSAIWQDQKNMADPDEIQQVLEAAGLPVAKLLSSAQQPEIKTALVDATGAAVERGLFGVPTMFIGDQMYFGQDRLDFVAEQLAAG